MNASNPNLVACKNCGRNFEPDSLARHEPICTKINRKKKRVFNSYKQRAEGTDIGPTRGASVGKNIPPPVSHWRQQHEDFISTIRNARMTTDAMKKGLPLPPPPPPSINPDYIECPYCNRRFNDTAAERHISFCKTNVNRKVVAKQSIQAPSTQPKAPSTKVQVQMASKPTPGPSRSSAVPSTSREPPRAPPVHSAPPVHTAPPARTGPSVYSPQSMKQTQQPSGSPSKGKLTAAAQAVMGVRPDFDDPPVKADARRQPPMQSTRYGRM